MGVLFLVVGLKLSCMFLMRGVSWILVQQVANLRGRGGCGGKLVSKRLDRAIADCKWRTMFLEALCGESMLHWHIYKDGKTDSTYRVGPPNPKNGGLGWHI